MKKLTRDRVVPIIFASGNLSDLPRRSYQNSLNGMFLDCFEPDATVRAPKEEARPVHPSRRAAFYNKDGCSGG
jgi:hypothetical protein